MEQAKSETPLDLEQATAPQQPAPDPAMQRLAKLVGRWDITGRTLDAETDDIKGQVTIEWLPGGFFLQQRGTMELGDFKVESLEIVGYDPATNTFPSYVYSNLSQVPAVYHWDVQGDEVSHWDSTSKYTGRFSEDGHLLVGGWRPNPGQQGPDNPAYDAVMTRLG